MPARPPVPASPPTGQADRRMRAYAEFAAFVRNLEHETEKIPYNRLALRKERYWGPLEAFVSQLIGKYRINPNRLAPLIEEGYKQSWPTEETGDRDMVARWFHHCKIEYKLIMRRADAQASRSALDSLTSMAVQQATAAGTLQNSANAAAGRRALGGR